MILVGPLQLRIFWDKCPQEPPVSSWLASRWAVTLHLDAFPPCAEPQPFVPWGPSQTRIPSTFCQSSGHRGVSVNSSPTKCFRSCFAGHCISNPCHMCQAAGNKGRCWWKSILHWQECQWLKTKYLYQKMLRFHSQVCGGVTRGQRLSQQLWDLAHT